MNPFEPRRVPPAVVLVLAAALTLGAIAGCADDSTGDGGRPPSDVGPTQEAAAPEVSVGAIDESEPVGPVPDSAFVGVRRDCGISAPLTDGSSLWFYCDTLRMTDDGSLEFFLNTSAARATPDDPLVMVDQPDRRGDLRPVIQPAPGYPPCRAGQGSFTWPTAAVTRPLDDHRDRVLVYFENACVLPGQLEGHDVGLAEVVYDHDDPPDPNHPLVATILEPRLFPREDGRPPFGLAAVAHDDRLYVYRCPAADEPCTVGRVRADEADDLAAYRYWTGDGWSDDPDDAHPMTMPDAREGTKPAVERLDALGLYVMANHPVADTGIVELRFAASPTGPWSDAVALDLPGCAGFYPEICFAAEVHDHLSTADSIGLTWFDPTVEPGADSPTRFAQVRVSTSPSTGDDPAD